MLDLQQWFLFFWAVWVYFGWRERLQLLLPQTDWLWGCHFFCSFLWRWSGVSRMLAGGADRIWSGSSTNLSPLEYGGFGPEQKGAVSCWDAESGLEVMGRREKEHCLWRGTKWITAIFLLLCLTVRVESGGPDNKGTEPQTKAKWRTAQEKNKAVWLSEYHVIYDDFLNVWWGHSHFSVNVSPDSGAGWWQWLEHFLLFLCVHSSHFEKQYMVWVFFSSGVLQQSWTEVIRLPYAKIAPQSRWSDASWYHVIQLSCPDFMSSTVHHSLILYSLKVNQLLCCIFTCQKCGKIAVAIIFYIIPVFS